MFEDVIKGIAMGAFYGAQAALFGYMKSNELPASWTVIFRKKFWESFDPVKAIETIILGAGLGAFTNSMSFVPAGTFSDSTEEAIFVNFANTAIIMGADQLRKFIVRRTPLIRVWNALKEKLGIV
jgi:hypothetical protein